MLMSLSRSALKECFMEAARAELDKFEKKERIFRALERQERAAQIEQAVNRKSEEA